EKTASYHSAPVPGFQCRSDYGHHPGDGSTTRQSDSRQGFHQAQRGERQPALHPQFLYGPGCDRRPGQRRPV
ncbi:MAG: hypothetical protein, partial [Olavius algarvensis Delta 4 endosymbiont]